MDSESELDDNRSGPKVVPLIGRRFFLGVVPWNAGWVARSYCGSSGWKRGEKGKRARLAPIADASMGWKVGRCRRHILELA